MDYKEKLEEAKKLYASANDDQKYVLESLFSELKESSKDEKVKKILHAIWDKMSFHLHDIFTEEEFQCFDAWSNAWLEKQGEQKNKINSCKITFEDVLALECSMKTAKITKGGDELYKILVPLYNKIHNAYLLEKQGEKKHAEWSEDDKNKLLIIEQILDCANLLISSQELTETKNWLKSLKQRMGG